MAEDLGLDIVTPCATTAATLYEDLNMMKSDLNLMGAVNSTLEKTTGRTLEGTVRIRHLLQVLVEDISWRHSRRKLRIQYAPSWPLTTGPIFNKRD